MDGGARRALEEEVVGRLASELPARLSLRGGPPLVVLEGEGDATRVLALFSTPRHPGEVFAYAFPLFADFDEEEFTPGEWAEVVLANVEEAAATAADAAARAAGDPLRLHRLS